MFHILAALITVKQCLSTKILPAVLESHNSAVIHETRSIRACAYTSTLVYFNHHVTERKGPEPCHALTLDRTRSLQAVVESKQRNDKQGLKTNCSISQHHARTAVEVVCSMLPNLIPVAYDWNRLIPKRKKKVGRGGEEGEQDKSFDETV